MSAPGTANDGTTSPGGPPLPSGPRSSPGPRISNDTDAGVAVERAEDVLRAFTDAMERLKASEKRAKQEAVLWKRLFEDERRRGAAAAAAAAAAAGGGTSPSQHAPAAGWAATAPGVRISVPEGTATDGAFPPATPHLSTLDLAQDVEYADGGDPAGASGSVPSGAPRGRGPPGVLGAAGGSGREAPRAGPRGDPLRGSVSSGNLAASLGLGPDAGPAAGGEGAGPWAGPAKALTTVVLTDDGAAGVGTTAAAAQAMSTARAWAVFTHESRQEVHRRPSLPGRVAYQLEASVSSRRHRPRDPRGAPSSAGSSKPGTPGGLGGAAAPGTPNPLVGPGPQLKLRWLNQPQTVLVIAKPDPHVMGQLLRVVSWLKNRGILVFVEPESYRHLLALARRSADSLDAASVQEGCDVLDRAMVQQLIASLSGDAPGRLVTWACQVRPPPPPIPPRPRPPPTRPAPPEPPPLLPPPARRSATGTARGRSGR